MTYEEQQIKIIARLSTENNMYKTEVDRLRNKVLSQDATIAKCNHEFAELCAENAELRARLSAVMLAAQNDVLDEILGAGEDEVQS